jgi:hypothetical protein
MSSERDFLKLSSSRISRQEANEFIGKLKESGLMDSMKGMATVPNALGALGGAALATGLEYALNKSRAAHPGEVKRPEPAVPGSSFSHDLAQTSAGARHDFQEMSARHPAMSAPLVAPLGAVTGLAAILGARKLLGI